MTYTCASYDYNTADKSNYNRHLKSKLHLKRCGDLVKQFTCTECNYTTTNQSNFNKHCKTDTHLKNLPTKEL